MNRRVAIILGAIVLAASPIAVGLLLSRDRRAASRAESGCRDGAAEACEELANRLASGRGIRRDVVRADELRAAAPRMRACGAGEGKACAQVAALWEAPHALAEDAAKANAMKKRACDLGEPDGCIALAEAKVRGFGMPADVRGGAVELRELAAKLHARSDARATSAYARACDLAAPNACLEAARSHPMVRLASPDMALAPAAAPPSFDGRRVLLTDAKLDDLAPSALPLLEKGCEQGDRAACVDRAHAAINAGGEDSASAWFLRLATLDDLACGHDDVDACARLAQVDGPPVTPAMRDRARAAVIGVDEKACKAASAPACKRLASVLRRSDPRRALDALDAACQASLVEACEAAFDLVLAPVLTVASSVASKRALYGQRVMELLESACAKDDAPRCLEGGRGASKGVLIPIDHKKALRLLSRACDLKERAGCCEAGLMMLSLDAEAAKSLIAKGGGQSECEPRRP